MFSFTVSSNVKRLLVISLILLFIGCLGRSTTGITTSSTTTLNGTGGMEDELDLDEANVIDVTYQLGMDGGYTFAVTLRHDDTGWEHYADWWRIKTLDDEELARRVLTHPHVDEQPFTRSLSGVEIPAHVTTIVVEGHDSVHGYGGRTMTVQLTKEDG